MNFFTKNKNVQLGFITLSALVTIGLWSFQKIEDDIFKILEALVLGAMVVIVISNTSILKKKNLIFNNYVHLFIWLPFLSAFGAYFYHDQPFSLSILLLRANIFWIFYFLLHIFEIPSKKIINLIIFIGSIWALLTIIQQFTYPTAYFYTRDDESQSILRAGVYRYMLSGQQYGLFVLLFFFYKYLTSKSPNKVYFLLFVVLGLLGFYYYGTRQFAVAAILCMGIAVLFLKSSLRAKYIALLVPVVLIMWLYRDMLFGQIIEMTNQQLEYGYEDNIRVLSADFYLNDYWPHWTTKLFGNGIPHNLTAYGKEMDFIISYYHFFRSDVGLIGTYNKYGVFYVLLILMMIIKILRIKIHNPDDKYLKLFFYNALFLVVTNEAFSSIRVIPFYCLILYLIDLSIDKHNNKEKLLHN